MSIAAAALALHGIWDLHSLSVIPVHGTRGDGAMSCDMISHVFFLQGGKV